MEGNLNDGVMHARDTIEKQIIQSRSHPKMHSPNTAAPQNDRSLLPSTSRQKQVPQWLPISLVCFYYHLL